MNIDMASLAAMNHNFAHLAIFACGVSQNGRAHRIEIPYIVRNILVVPFVGAGIEVDCDDRVGIEVVTGTFRAIQIRRGIADDEERGFRFQINRRRHPHATAEGFVEVAAIFCEGFFFRCYVALHVTVRCVVRIPNAFVTFFRNRVERPPQFTVIGVISFDEATDAVLAAVGADQHFTVDRNRRHGFGITEFGIGDFGFPKELSGFRVERNQLGIQRAHEQLAVQRSDASVVRTAAECRDRAHFMFVMPELFAGNRVNCVDMVIGCRQEHYAIDDQRCGFH